MRLVLISLFLFLSLNLYAQYPFTPKNEEIGIKGLYTLQSSILPEKYRNLWHAAKFDIPKLLASNKRSTKHFKDLKNPFLWTFYIDESINPKRAPGVLVLVSDIHADPIPDQWKKLCKSQNLILAIPDFSKTERRYSCSLEMTLATLDLIKPRFPICESRIYYVGIGNNIPHLAHLYTPAIFNGSFAIMSNFGWDSHRLQKKLGKEKHLAFISEVQKQYFYLLEIPPVLSGFKVTKTFYETESIKENIVFHTPLFKMKNYKLSLKNPDQTSVLKKLEVTDQTPTNEIYKNIDYDDLSYALRFLSSNRNELLAKLLKNAQLHIDNKKYGLALKAYWQSYALNHNKALEDIKPLEEVLKNEELKAMKLFSKNEYYEAYLLANKLVNEYSQLYAKNASSVIDEIHKDKNIVLEIKAASFLAKAEAALKQSPVPVDKIKAACDKVIQTVPGTVTAEKAKQIMDSLK